jgi:nucleoid-associated protein YgaU
MALTRMAKNGLSLIVVAALVGGGIYAYKTFGHKAGTLPQLTQSTSADTDVPQTPARTEPTQAPVSAPAIVPNKDALASIQQNGVVRISVENPSEPFYGEDGTQAHGFNVEFAKLLFSQSEFGGRPIQIDTHHEVEKYSDVPKQLLLSDSDGNSTVDIAMDGLTYEDNTPQGVVYSNPYVEDFGYALIVGPGSHVRTSNDVSSATIGILKGDPDVKAFVKRTFPDATIKEVSDSDPDFIAKSVDGHLVDAFVYDYPFAVDSIKNSDLKFAITKLDGSDISYKIGVRAADQNLLFRLNSAIAKVMRSPAYTDLLRKYFVSSQVDVVAASGSERSYVVKAGDTLGSIATSQLGAQSKWASIQKRNNLANPNLITVGQKLVIPRA